VKRCLEAQRSRFLKAMDQGFDRSNPDRRPEAGNAREGLPSLGRWKRLSGILLSGLLMIGLLAGEFLAAPSASQAASIAVGINVGVAPPPIPVYTQPVCPGPGYIWTPGYRAYDPVNGYYWVPGTWVVAPAPGLLWTPGYWGWSGTAFVFHLGYWGPHVGFYGGINYGFGYPGVGFVGGEWRGGAFFYNRSVANLGPGHFAHVYYRSVPSNFAVSRVSYNSGAGGLRARPTSGELAAEHDRHMEATAMQHQHEMAAHNERAQFASVNHGRPDVAATRSAGEFHASGVTRASRAGSASGGYRAGSYSGARSPNPGGGTHQVMTAHANPAPARSSSARPAGTTAGGSHSSTPSHNEVSRAPAPNHQAPSHESHSQPHGSESHH